MHVAIDLGETHSYLACWEKGTTLEDACIKIKLPGVAAFRAVGSEYAWQPANMHAYFSFIYHEYLLPVRIIIESAALAIPGIFGLNMRRMMLDILEEIFGLYEATIIPHPLALIAGIQMHTPFSLWGDVMVLEERELSYYNCAFISIIETIGITLEEQLSGTMAEVLEAAELHGYNPAQGWRFDHLLLAGSPDFNPILESFIASLPPTLNVIDASDLDFLAAEGLAASFINENSAPGLPFNVIYPFEFYVEKNNQVMLERIPFDTSNLELNCAGQYRMLRLDRSGINTLTADEHRVQFCIYELRRADEPYFLNPQPEPRPVLEIDIPLNDMPPYIELRLDMSAAAIQLDFKTDPSDNPMPIPIFFEARLKANQQKLYAMLSVRKQNESLLKDWNKYLLSAGESSPTLPDQIDQTLFHLYGLLQLWQNK